MRVPEHRAWRFDTSSPRVTILRFSLFEREEDQRQRATRFDPSTGSGLEALSSGAVEQVFRLVLQALATKVTAVHPSRSWYRTRQVAVWRASRHRPASYFGIAGQPAAPLAVLSVIYRARAASGDTWTHGFIARPAGGMHTGALRRSCKKIFPHADEVAEPARVSRPPFCGNGGKRTIDLPGLPRHKEVGAIPIATLRTHQRVWRSGIYPSPVGHAGRS